MEGFRRVVQYWMFSLFASLLLASEVSSSRHSSLEVLLGGNAALPCAGDNASENVLLAVPVWQKNGAVLSVAESKSLSLDTLGGLHITGVRGWHAGLYTCSRGGVQRTAVTLLIKGVNITAQVLDGQTGQKLQHTTGSDVDVTAHVGQSILLIANTPPAHRSPALRGRWYSPQGQSGGCPASSRQQAIQTAARGHSGVYTYRVDGLEARVHIHVQGASGHQSGLLACYLVTLPQHDSRAWRRKRRHAAPMLRGGIDGPEEANGAMRNGDVRDNLGYGVVVMVATAVAVVLCASRQCEKEDIKKVPPSEPPAIKLSPQNSVTSRASSQRSSGMSKTSSRHSHGPMLSAPEEVDDTTSVNSRRTHLDSISAPSSAWQMPSGFRDTDYDSSSTLAWAHSVDDLDGEPEFQHLTTKRSIIGLEMAQEIMNPLNAMITADMSPEARRRCSTATPSNASMTISLDTVTCPTDIAEPQEQDQSQLQSTSCTSGLDQQQESGQGEPTNMSVPSTQHQPQLADKQDIEEEGKDISMQDLVSTPCQESEQETSTAVGAYSDKQAAWNDVQQAEVEDSLMEAPEADKCQVIGVESIGQISTEHDGTSMVFHL